MNTSFPLCAALALTVFLTSGCDTTPSRATDTRTVLMRTKSGTQAVPPVCGKWDQDFGNPWRNDPWPNFGCAQAHNLAQSVERGEDLIAPRELGPADAALTAAAIDRYRAGKTVPLIDAKSESPVTVVIPSTASSPK